MEKLREKMDDILEYAKKYNISIQDACALHETVAKIQFYSYLMDRLEHVKLYIKKENQ